MDKQLQVLQQNLEAAAQRADAEGIEFWFARDLQADLGYARWENFQMAINRAMEQLIARCPAQYFWSYNRYKTPAGVAAPAIDQEKDVR